MARRRYAQTEARTAKFKKEGRGTGTGPDYKPWLKISDVPSRGRVHRVFCTKTDREHHLLSDNEFYAFLALWWDDDVIDIREQFPLDRRETMEIAAGCGIRHPVDPTSQAVLVLTTDLVATVRTPFEPMLRAVAVKEVKDLSHHRTLEKLEIERSYWARHGVPWSLMVSDDLKTNFTRNLAWIYDPGPRCRGDEISRQADELLLPHLLEAILAKRDVAVRHICLEIDADLGLAPGRTLACLRRLLAAKRIRAPIDVPLVQDLPGSAFMS